MLLPVLRLVTLLMVMLLGRGSLPRLVAPHGCGWLVALRLRVRTVQHAPDSTLKPLVS